MKKCDENKKNHVQEVRLRRRLRPDYKRKHRKKLFSICKTWGKNRHGLRAKRHKMILTLCWQNIDIKWINMQVKHNSNPTKRSVDYEIRNRSIRQSLMQNSVWQWGDLEPVTATKAFSDFNIDGTVMWQLGRPGVQWRQHQALNYAMGCDWQVTELRETSFTSIQTPWASSLLPWWWWEITRTHWADI